MKDFFIDKFEFDYLTNKRWCEHLETIDVDNSFIVKSMSHLINVHHIWVSRLLKIQPESHSWDHLPISYWIKFCQENQLKTIDYLERFEWDEKINYHDEEGVQISKQSIDILYHILHHSNYHRAQVARELKTTGQEVPTFNFIAYR